MQLIKKSKGFGLIEVLISTVIMSTALMALASLQIQAVRGVQEASRQSNAVMIAEDIANRMMSNRIAMEQKENSGYVIASIAGLGASSISKCGQDTDTNTQVNCMCQESDKSTCLYKNSGKPTAIADLQRIESLLSNFIDGGAYSIDASIDYIKESGVSSTGKITLLGKDIDNKTLGAKNIFVINVCWKTTSLTDNSTTETLCYKLFV